MAFKGDFTPVLHKHTKNLDLIDLISVGVDKMQRNFNPLKQQIDDWKMATLIDDEAKMIIYEAFGEQRFPTRLLPSVHQHYFQPAYEAFAPRTLWSLSNAFTSAFKKLTPVRQFQLTAKLGIILAEVLISMPFSNEGLFFPKNDLSTDRRGYFQRQNLRFYDHLL